MNYNELFDLMMNDEITVKCEVVFDTYHDVITCDGVTTLRSIGD